MSAVREREKTRRMIWIVSGFILALAIAITAYRATRRTEAPDPSAASADASAYSVQNTPATPEAARPVARETASAVQVAPTRVAVATPPEPAEPVADDTSSDPAADPNDSAAPKLSAEEQSLADAVGDTRRAAPTAPAAVGPAAVTTAN